MTTFGGRLLLVEENLWWKTTFSGSLHAAYSTLRYFLVQKRILHQNNWGHRQSFFGRVGWSAKWTLIVPKMDPQIEPLMHHSIQAIFGHDSKTVLRYHFSLVVLCSGVD